MKIAVYAIAKNEAKHVERWLEGIKEADGVFVLDTGSDDCTPELLQQYGANVHQQIFDPWRFDVARNASLDNVPSHFDVAFAIDLDEIPTPGWRDAVERAFVGPVNRLYYKFVWNHNPDGTDGVTMFKEKCHTRHGFYWQHPVHEILKPNLGTIETFATCHEFVLHHWADDTKPRTSYLPLLQLAVQEDWDDDRNAHYLGREYLNYGRHDEAIHELKRHLNLPRAIWEPERAASMRYIARAYVAKGDNVQAWKWAMRACAEAPREREPWIELGQAYNRLEQHEGCYFAMQQALNITERPQSYICEPASWGALPYDFMGISSYYLGRKHEARFWFQKAYDLEPTDPRLLANLQFTL